MVLAFEPSCASALLTSPCTTASVTLVGGVELSTTEVAVRLDSWMLPVMSEYCVMTLNAGLVPNCVKKLVMCCASALGVAAVPHVSDGPQKIGTTFALRISGPL